MRCWHGRMTHTATIFYAAVLTEIAVTTSSLPDWRAIPLQNVFKETCTHVSDPQRMANVVQENIYASIQREIAVQ